MLRFYRVDDKVEVKPLMMSVIMNVKGENGIVDFQNFDNDKDYFILAKGMNGWGYPIKRKDFVDGLLNGTYDLYQEG